MISWEVPSFSVALWNLGLGYCRDWEIPCPVRTRAHNAAGEAKTVIHTTNEWTWSEPGLTEYMDRTLRFCICCWSGYTPAWPCEGAVLGTRIEPQFLPKRTEISGPDNPFERNCSFPIRAREGRNR
ncbi:uncharacterized protein BDW70DRAFT_139655 [Aspergillus foveolatus]|uniref:uncharacterized protein n=1 Tax=Aspergillus foveolatus TaxID=210207 RepID=UPI003CCDE90E